MIANIIGKKILKEKMLEFIETQDGDYDDEWYASPRDFAASILTDFAKYIGVELIVPDYIPKKAKPEIDRNKLLQELLPELTKLFDVKIDKSNLKKGHGND